jgi:hypothetical protein
MGVSVCEGGYTSASTGRGDHEVHKGHVVALGEKIPCTQSRKTQWPWTASCKMFTGCKSAVAWPWPPNVIQCRGQRKSWVIRLLKLGPFMARYRVNFAVYLPTASSKMRNVSDKYQNWISSWKYCLEFRNIKWDRKERAGDDVRCYFWLGIPTSYRILWKAHWTFLFHHK